MSSGFRRDPIEFEQWTEGYDASGWSIETNWFSLTPELKAWGRYRPNNPNRGDSYWAAKQIQSDVVGVMEVPYIERLVKLLTAAGGNLAAIRIKMCAGVPPDPGGSALFRYFKIDSYFDPDQKRKTLHLMVTEELLT